MALATKIRAVQFLVVMDAAFAQVLARTTLGLTRHGAARDHTFDEAERIADGTCSDALREAVRRMPDGDASGTMLAALERRFTEMKSAGAVAVVDLSVGTITIADVLWPEFEGDRAAASLKVYVSRLRKLAGDRFFSVRQPHGYALGTPPRIIRGSTLAARFARWASQADPRRKPARRSGPFQWAQYIVPFSDENVDDC